MPRHKQSNPTSIKSSVIRLRVTEAEAEMFRSKAAESGCKTVSEYIRSKCLTDDSGMDNDAVKEPAEL
jgi:uncharacterized protein YqfA (UPF0365 family)